MKLFRRIVALLLLITVFVLCSCDVDNNLPKVNEVTYASVSIDGDTYYDINPDGQSNEQITLRAHVLNIGQGSCIVLESDGDYVVIDTGDGEHASYVFSAITNSKYIGTTRLEFLIFTHYDADHIGNSKALGAGAGLVKNMKIGSIYGPNIVPDNPSRAYLSLMASITAKGMIVKHPKEYDELYFGDCTITFISGSKEYEGKTYDNGTTTTTANENSLAMLIEDKYGNVLYVGGDSGIESEKDQADVISDYLDDNKKADNVDVYLVNHHGAKTSSTDVLLDAMNADYAIISCGKENKHGHPSEETIRRLNERNIKIYYTYNVKKGENIQFVFSEKGVFFE